MTHDLAYLHNLTLQNDFCLIIIGQIDTIVGLVYYAFHLNQLLTEV